MNQTSTDKQTDEPATNRPRRLWRWLIAGLLVLILVPAAMIGYRYQRQMALIERLTSGTGSIVTVPRGPAWLRSVVEADRLRGIDDIIIVNHLNQPTTDELRQLARQPLRELQLLDADLTADGARYLGEMEELRVLEFGARSRVSEEMLKEIASLPNLTAIRITNKRGMPRGASEADWLLNEILGESMFDRWFGLDETFISGSLAPLQGMSQLQELSIRNRFLTENDLAEIGGLKHLESLNIIECEIVEDGVRHLADLPKLTSLSFVSSNLTDESLKEFYGHPMLKRLDISFTQVTAAGSEQLKEHLTGCEIIGSSESTLQLIIQQ